MRQIPLAVPKFMHLLLITKLPNNTIDILHKIQKEFIWQGKKQKLSTAFFAMAMKMVV